MASEHPVAAALVGVQLGPDKPLGGVEFLERMVNQPAFRGAIVSTSATDATIEERLAIIRATARDWQVRFCPKPSRLVGRFQAAINVMMENLWDVLHGTGTQKPS